MNIRCHNGYCSFSYSPSDCPLCRGTGWHRCGGVEADAKLMAGTKFDHGEWGRHLPATPAASSQDKP